VETTSTQFALLAHAALKASEAALVPGNSNNQVALVLATQAQAYATLAQVAKMRELS
jgi:hypothetical protein